MLFIYKYQEVLRKEYFWLKYNKIRKLENMDEKCRFFHWSDKPKVYTSNFYIQQNCQCQCCNFPSDKNPNTRKRAEIRIYIVSFVLMAGNMYTERIFMLQCWKISNEVSHHSAQFICPLTWFNVRNLLPILQVSIGYAHQEIFSTYLKHPIWTTKY